MYPFTCQNEHLLISYNNLYIEGFKPWLLPEYYEISIFSYINQMVAEYNVKCEPGTTAFLQFDELNLEPKNCYDGRTMKYEFNNQLVLVMN